MAAQGHEDAFPPTTLSNRSRLGKPTFAGTRDNEQDAPKTTLTTRGSEPAGFEAAVRGRETRPHP